MTDMQACTVRTLASWESINYYCFWKFDLITPTQCTCWCYILWRWQQHSYVQKERRTKRSSSWNGAPTVSAWQSTRKYLKIRQVVRKNFSVNFPKTFLPLHRERKFYRIYSQVFWRITKYGYWQPVTQNGEKFPRAHFVHLQLKHWNWRHTVKYGWDISKGNN